MGEIWVPPDPVTHKSEGASTGYNFEYVPSPPLEGPKPLNNVWELTQIDISLTLLYHLEGPVEPKPTSFPVTLVLLRSGMPVFSVQEELGAMHGAGPFENLYIVSGVMVADLQNPINYYSGQTLSFRVLGQSAVKPASFELKFGYTLGPTVGGTPEVVPATNTITYGRRR